MTSAENKAVFLSYASQDAEAVRRIAETLRAAGVEVWFDQNELVGGDAWDAKIRGQIASCALFVPVISANTQERREGYFRIEWRLAAQRTHAMSDDTPFLLPVVIDTTRDTEAKVPAEFRAVQWTKLPGGETPEKFCARVKTLLDGSKVGTALRPDDHTPQPVEPGHKAHPPKTGSAPRWLVPALLGAGGLLAMAVWPLWKKAAPAADLSAGAAPASAQTEEVRHLVAQMWALLNKAELARSEIETADDLGKRATALAPKDADAWAAWSQVDSWGVYHNFANTPERRESARTKAAKAIQLAPHSFEARLAVVCQIVRAGDTDFSVSAFAAQAEATLGELLQERPAEPRTLLVLAILQRNLGKQEAARATFLQLTANPRFAATAWTELGWAEGGWGNPRASLAAADRAVAIQPFWGNLSLKTENALWWLGDRDVAKAAFERMPAESLQEDFVISEGAFLYYARREPEVMLRLLASAPREWLTSNLFDGPAGYLSGNAHAMAKRPDAARQHWERALRLVDGRLSEKPNVAQLVFWKGRLQALTGHKPEAAKTIALARQLAVTQSQRGDRGWESAVDQLLVGSPDEALQMLEEAMERKRVTLAALEVEPDFDPLRDTPRFKALLARAKADPKLSPMAETATPVAVPADQSVAVLAFKNLSGDPAREFFSDGLSGAVTDVLGRVPGLKVVASASAFSFKGKNVPVPEIARQLGVSHLVEGTVLQDGSTVRITAKLIKADGFQVWGSDNLDRELKNILALHDEVAGLIAKQLSLKLGVGTAEAKREVNPEAYAPFLRARFFSRGETIEGWKSSIEQCKLAVALDPKLALAWAEMARCYIQLARFSGLGLAEAFAEARAAAERAVALAPDLSEAQNALGWVQRTADWDWRRASASFKRAFELAPGNAAVISDYAIILNNTGHFAEAIEMGRRAVALDPLNASTRAHLALFLGWAGRYDEAVAEIQRAIALAPAATEWHAYLARFELLRGNVEAAAAAADAEVSPRYQLILRALIQVSRQQRPAADRLIQEAVEKYAEREAGYIAEYYAWAGERDLAFTWLERARERRETIVVWMLGQRTLDSLHADPRWPAFLKKIGLSDDQLK